MEKFNLFLRSFRPWQLILIAVSSVVILISVFFASKYLQRQAKLKLGSDAGLTLSADRQDSLGTFSDSAFTLKSDTDLTVSTLKDNIVFFPVTDFDVRQVNPRQFSISPKSPLKDNSLYRIKILSEQRTFSWAFQTKNDFRVVQTLPRDKATYVPLNTGIEITFSHENWQDINQKDESFEITPFVEGRFERHKRTLSFIPKNLKPDTLYTIKIKKGVKLNGTNETLKEDFVYRFETQSQGERASVLGFSRSFYEFSPSETPAFDIYSSSQGGADLNIKVYRESAQSFYSDFTTKLAIPNWASNTLRLNRLSVDNSNKILEFNTPIQQQTYTNFFLLPQTLPKGLYLVEANIGGGGGITTQALVQITDLSSYTTISGTKTLVWVNDIKSGTPVPGAKVTFSGTGQNTGSDGTAYFDTPVNNVDENQILTIQKDDQTLYVPIKNSNYYFDSSYQKSRRLADKYWNYFYTDRPVYLPTDSLKFWGLLRDRDNLNQKQKFTLEVTRTDYNSWDFTPVTLFNKDYETSDLGTFIGDIPLNNYNPGYYSILIKIDDSTVMSSSFSIETYTKPAYKLSLTPSKNSVIAGETITFSGQASFFEGSPVPGMDLKYLAQGNNGNVTSDSLGNYSFTYTATDNSIYYSPQSQYFSIMPVLPEEGQITATANIAIFDSGVVFAPTKTESKNKTGKVEISLKQVDTGKYSVGSNLDIFAPASGRQITGSLIENQWERKEVGTYYDFINKTTSPRYEYTRIQNTIAEVNLTTDSSGKAVYQFPVSENKSYNLKVSATDDQSRTTNQDIYVSGYEYNYTNNFVFLKTDKGGANPNAFTIGESVNLQVMQGESPLDSIASDKFLYLFAQRGLKSYQLSDGNQLSFKFPDTFVPNVMVTAVRFTGKAYQVSETLNLLFDTSAKKLTLNVTQDKTSYLPGDTAKLFVTTKDQNGSGTPAEVNLSLLDEAYNTLYSTIVDPLSRIYNSVDSDILATYQSHRYPLDIGGAEGGGCFLPGTQILLSNGTTKNIENITVGDSVKTLADTASNKLVSAKVVKTFKHQVAGYLVFNNLLRVTSEHNLFINGRFMTASEAKVGDFYLDSFGDYRKIYSIENRSGVNTVYNFTVEKLSTYFADGFYVHNQKGRELFVDNAFFGSVRTGSDGKGSLDVKLPDNLTSWRITSQGVTSDLKAGVNSSLLVVKQPFFVDAVMGTEYLAGERPQILVRAYGESLSSSDQVSIRVQSDTLGIDKNVSAKAFESTKVDFGELKEGIHKITFSAQSGNNSDKLIRSISVIKSRLKVVKTSGASLTAQTKPEGSSDSSTTLIFSDLSLGRYYPPLSSLAYTWGDRLDQRLARSVSQEVIKKYFDDTLIPEKLDYSAFQTPEGGFALFPYASADVELSSFVAALGKDKVDSVGLANYFYRQLSQINDDVVYSQALFGLASLEEPVLVLLNNFGETKDLSPLARIYLSLAQAKIGDAEKARLSYRNLMSEFSVKQDVLTYVKVGKDKDDYLFSTALLSAVASLLNEPEADSLLAYTLANETKDILLVSPQLLSVSAQLVNIVPQPVSFAYTLDGKKVSKKLEKGQVFKIQVSPKELSGISFSDIEGNVGLTSSFSVPLDPKSAQTNSSVQIGRSFSVKGKTTNSFSGSDLIKVTLPYNFSQISQDGCYQVSDLLPSGLKPITAIYSFGLDTTNVWYPYEINGQRVSFCVGKGNTNKTITYYARVVSAGDFKAESALIQSLVSPSIFNLSPAGAVTVK